MRIIRNNILPFKGFSSMNLFGILLMGKNARLGEKTLNHERIHAAQWRELWYVGFILWYLVEWLIRLPFGNAYRNISFEREAYANDDNSTYLGTRKRFAFVKYMKI